MQETYPIALLVADIHLSLKSPVWRSSEKDWLSAMARPLSELQELSEELDVPILCAGDIFDKWYGAHQSSELINFAIEHLPKMYAIPGQHDLSNHNLSEIKRSAFWTLVEADKVRLLKPEGIRISSEMDVYGYPFGIPIDSIEKRDKKYGLQIAIAHQYVWIDGFSYKTASIDNKLSSIQSNLSGYDVVVFGDNHKHFITSYKQTILYNCGGFLKRKSDEVDYEPVIGILYNDGTIKTHKIDTTKDKYMETIKSSSIADVIDLKDFIKELERLGHTDLDFIDATEQYCKSNNVNKNVRKILINAMETQGDQNG